MSDSLQLDPEKGLELPPTYADHEGGLVIRTPRSTIDHKAATMFEDYYPLVDDTHFDLEGTKYDVHNPELDDYTVTLKRYGEEAETFSVTI